MGFILQKDAKVKFMEIFEEMILLEPYPVEDSGKGHYISCVATVGFGNNFGYKTYSLHSFNSQVFIIFNCGFGDNGGSWQ